MPRKKKTEIQAPQRVLTEAELFYIKEKANTQTAEEIATAIQVPVEVVKPYLPETKPSRTRALFENRTRNKRKGVNIMTEAASQMGDETAAAARAAAKKKSQMHIFKPYGADYDRS